MLLRRRALNMGTINIYGITKDYTASGTAWTRTDSSTDFTFTGAVGTSGYQSSFDSCYPWSEMKRETLATGDVMVKIPRFWYRRFRSGNNESIQIADGPAKDFLLHPLFIHDDVELPYVYVGAYETIANHYSKPGSSPLVNTTRSGFRSGAKNKGNGWSQYDIAAWNAIQLLYLVEVADNNSQAKVGSGNSSTSAAIKTGGCDSLYTADCYSGRASGTDTSVAVMYRGIENLWGNVWKWVDGINWNGGTYYICTDPTKYADDTTTGYTQLSYTGGSTSYSQSYISRLGLDENNSWCMMTTAASGSATTYLCDTIWSSTGWRVCLSGGVWTYGSCCGLFATFVDSGSSDSYTTSGGRLLYRPL